MSMVIGGALLHFALLAGATPKKQPNTASEHGEERALLCVAGKSIPQVYLLGVAKAGTTSIATDMFKVGFKSASAKGNGEQVKELHAFDKWCPAGECPTPTADVRQEWVANFTVACGAKGLTDCTPQFYFFGLPRMLKDVYGQSGHKLTFLVVLRDPMSRLRSMFNQHLWRMRREESRGKGHALRRTPIKAGRGNTNRIKGNRPQSLQEYVDQFNASCTEKQMRSKASGGRSWDAAVCSRGNHFIHASMYSLHFTDWLGAFAAEQFTVLPRMKYFGSIELARGLLGRVARITGLEVDVNAVEMPSHRNARAHASRSEALRGASREWLAKEFFEPDGHRLSRLLSSAAKSGLHLYGYDLEPTPDKVHDYLLSSW